VGIWRQKRKYDKEKQSSTLNRLSRKGVVNMAILNGKCFYFKYPKRAEIVLL